VSLDEDTTYHSSPCPARSSSSYAETHNARFTHYDLGAGGRSVTTDCHDGSNPDTSGFDPNGGSPHCYTGGKVQGASVGMKYRF
jgi:hypothetical protein